MTRFHTACLSGYAGPCSIDCCRLYHEHYDESFTPLSVGVKVCVSENTVLRPLLLRCPVRTEIRRAVSSLVRHLIQRKYINIRTILKTIMVTSRSGITRKG